jgi:hypothetical protein
MTRLTFLAAASAALMFAIQAAGLDHISFSRGEKTLQVTGKVIIEAEDGGLLAMDRAGVLWAIPPEEKKSLQSDDVPFELLGKEDLGKQLLAELPEGFRLYSTAHYLIAYNTSPAYAQWCGALYERLYFAFSNYWQKRGFQITSPTAPLVALVFDNKTSFAQYSQAELGKATGSIFGYFSLASNRVIMYDLTGADAVNTNRRGSTTEQVNRVLSRPEAERTVATIVHEATHQLAFNCGLHQRYADIPLWVSEGVAIYFETPDLKSSKGWKGVGNVNQVRFAEFIGYLPARPQDSLKTLLRSDERFRNTRVAAQAYAEAWALNYFLLHKYADKYKSYLRRLAAKKPLLFDTPEERIQEFEKSLGKNIAELDVEFVRFVTTIR